MYGIIFSKDLDAVQLIGIYEGKANAIIAAMDFLDEIREKASHWGDENHYLVPSEIQINGYELWVDVTEYYRDKTDEYSIESSKYYLEISPDLEINKIQANAEL